MGYRGDLENIVEFFRPGAFAFFVLAVFSIVAVGWHVFDGPSPAMLAAGLEELFVRFGVPMVFVAAVIETSFMLGFYLPGSLVIVLGVLYSSGSPAELVAIAVASFCGIFTGSVIDYFLGYYGFHRLFRNLGGEAALNRSRSWGSRWGVSSMVLFGFHPNIIALISVHRGLLRQNFLQFVVQLCIALAVWVPLAVIVLNAAGQWALRGDARPDVIIVLGLLTWGMFSCIASYVRRKRAR